MSYNKDRDTMRAKMGVKKREQYVPAYQSIKSDKKVQKKYLEDLAKEYINHHSVTLNFQVVEDAIKIRNIKFQLLNSGVRIIDFEFADHNDFLNIDDPNDPLDEEDPFNPYDYI